MTVKLTSEDAAIVHRLRHVAFMAWLEEASNGRDAAVMLASIRASAWSKSRGARAMRNARTLTAARAE